MNDFWNEAMNEISDSHLAEAISPKKKRTFPWMGAVAASLAAAVLIGTFFPWGQSGDSQLLPTDPSLSQIMPQIMNPTTPTVPTMPIIGLLSEPVYPNMTPYPSDPNSAPSAVYDAWKAGLRQQYDQPQDYADSLESFFTRSIPLFLEDTAENAVCSPLNIYMALSMLAETTGGTSRAAVLNALNANSIEALRTQAGHVWNAHYRSDGASDCLLANSLWLNEGFLYNENTVKTLSDSYYASVFQGDLGSESMTNALRAWLSVQTQGLLDQYLDGIQLSPRDALALASTVYFRAQWDAQFWDRQNTEGIFHSPSGDAKTTFMNQTLTDRKSVV